MDVADASTDAAGTADEEHWALAAAALGGELADKAHAAILAGLADPTVAGAQTALENAAVNATGADPLAPSGTGDLATEVADEAAALNDAVADLVIAGRVSALSLLECAQRALETISARAVAATGTQDAVRFARMAGRVGALAADATQVAATVTAVNTAITNLQVDVAACVPGTLTVGNAHAHAQAVSNRANLLLAATNAMQLNPPGPREALCTPTRSAAPASPRVRIEYMLEVATWAHAQALASPNTDEARQHAWLAGLAARHAVYAVSGIVGAATAMGDAALASETALDATNASAVADALAARNSIQALLQHIYRTHIFETRTSLRKGEAMFRKVKGIHSSYTSHAYDHMLTVGFTAVSNPRFVDLFLTRFPDMGTVTHGSSKQIKRAFDNAFRTEFNTVYGTSDHLPVSIEVTL